ncbi:hypothetical protein SAMN05444358_107131 [Ruegeria halocynthiae]|uniref:Methyltransferase FkbM domain-containing protein n=1 Tax=Ruegeria halocynthiae TaxID=985054 RepID=A0A1H3CTU2_9RHOB|nr:hypothetical protein [Ruegeria halocynthiae]SDX57535.1 hypothetical protein SAMN05444358_107131 [Ruegeria halocynthiae]
MTIDSRRKLLADVLRPFDVGQQLIRIGAFGDGGYLLPNDLIGIEACFSPGVSKQSSFELDLAKWGIPSIMADASVDGPAEVIPGATFSKQYLGAQSKGDVISLEDWMKQNAPETGDLMLQMDIEAAEYPVFETLPAVCLDRFRIIVIELHRIPSILTKPRFFEKAKPLYDAIGAKFTCVHLHTNNASGSMSVDGVEFPRVVEATFLRNDRIKTRRPISTLPHPLDVPHHSGRAEIDIPAEWLYEPG